MKLNIIILCLKLWAVVCFIAFICGIIRSIRAKREHNIQKRYLMQFIFLAERGMDSGDIIRELHYSFINEKRVRKILIKAMRMAPSQGLDYIYQKIGCDPMKIIHGFVLGREKKQGRNQLPKIPKDIISYFNNLIVEWDEKVIHNRIEKNRRTISALLEVIVFILLDLWLYSYIRTDISLMIFGIVNTLGVIMFIILTNEGYVVDKKKRERKRASKIAEEKKTQSSKWLQSMYQMVGGLGLIINIFIIVSEWLVPVA